MTEQIKNVPLTIIDGIPNFEQIDNDSNEPQLTREELEFIDLGLIDKQEDIELNNCSIQEISGDETRLKDKIGYMLRERTEDLPEPIVILYSHRPRAITCFDCWCLLKILQKCQEQLNGRFFNNSADRKENYLFDFYYSLILTSLLRRKLAQTMFPPTLTQEVLTRLRMRLTRIIRDFIQEQQSYLHQQIYLKAIENLIPFIKEDASVNSCLGVLEDKAQMLRAIFLNLEQKEDKGQQRLKPERQLALSLISAFKDNEIDFSSERNTRYVTVLTIALEVAKEILKEDFNTDYSLPDIPNLAKQVCSISKA